MRESEKWKIVHEVAEMLESADTFDKELFGLGDQREPEDIAEGWRSFPKYPSRAELERLSGAEIKVQPDGSRLYRFTNNDN